MSYCKAHWKARKERKISHANRQSSSSSPSSRRLRSTRRTSGLDATDTGTTTTPRTRKKKHEGNGTVKKRQEVPQSTIIDLCDDDSDDEHDEHDATLQPKAASASSAAVQTTGRNTKPKKRAALMTVSTSATAASTTTEANHVSAGSSSSSIISIQTNVPVLVKSSPGSSGSPQKGVTPMLVPNNQDLNSNGTSSPKSRRPKDPLVSLQENESRLVSSSNHTTPSDGGSGGGDCDTPTQTSPAATTPLETHNHVASAELAAEVAELEDEPVNPKDLICWSCMDPLSPKMTSNQPKDGSQQSSFAFANYAVPVHAHPCLHVSTCASCAASAYIVEADVMQLLNPNTPKQQGPHASSTITTTTTTTPTEGVSTNNGERMEVDKEMDVCSWCAGEACVMTDNHKTDNEEEDLEELLCCDNCPRVFCARCVALSHGSGPKGRREANRARTETCKWLCPHCSQPKELLEMQAFFLTLVQDPSSGKETTIGDTDDDDSQSHSSTAQLVEELNHVEDALEEAAAQLEDSSLEKKRVEFEEEFMQSGIVRPAAKVTQMVDEEMERFRTQWEIHHLRLCDTVTSLQDALEAHGIDIGAFYKEREQSNKGDDANHHDGTEETETPNWVAEADASLDKRDIEMNLPRGAFKGASREYDAYGMTKSQYND
eukprot:scaffold249115_cov57-Attheya_sp.AAC.2